jgi:hypothetical protein
MSCAFFCIWKFAFPYFKKAKSRLTPQEQILQTLERLHKQNAIAVAPRDFYEQMTKAMRAYIEREYNLRALYSTTPEFLKLATSSLFFNEETRMALAEFLNRADLVKFAHYKPTQEDCAQALATAKLFLELATRPQEGQEKL